MGDVNRGFQAQLSVALNLVKQQSCSRSCRSSSSSIPLIRIVHVVSHKARWFFIPLWPLCCSVFLKAEQIQLVKKQSSSSSSPPPPLFAISPYKCRLFGNSFDSSERSLSILDASDDDDDNDDISASVGNRDRKQTKFALP
ncbi:hypothetical protein T05_15083 [Trichinella murrelli]|uniref:Uncharacterized protein n=1 Tax=Trichinella murrelli TaxID=144512 RepID=A0A0V0TUY6_9BILA|nr:hypothetical protein T05_15083 [Trichinella murrelli]